MTAKRFEVVMNEFDEVEYIMDKAMMEDRDFAEFIDFVEDVCKENEQLKQDKDLFAQCICDLSNLLYDNKIEHKLPKDIKDFITVWGVRVE